MRNTTAWFNNASVTSLPILGSVSVTADGGKLQIATQTIGSSGATNITGGGANGIASYLNSPASVDSGSTRYQVNLADMSMFVVDQVVKVSNSIASRKAKNFVAGDTISVLNVNGSTGIFKANKRNSITLASTNQISITDVSATYGRSAGIVWRWTAALAPLSPFLGAVVGDSFLCDNILFSAGNRSPGVYGDGQCSSFPIVGVDIAGQWVDVQNPLGVSEGPITLGTPVGITIAPTFFVEWKHKLHASDVMSVTSLGFRNMFKYTWISGMTSPLFAQNGASVDDYVVISGNTFSPENRGTFRIVAVADNYLIIENSYGMEESVSVVSITDLRIFYSESAIIGDKLNVSDLVFSQPNRGTFTIINYGTDATLLAQYVTLSILSSSTQASVSLTGLPNTFFVTDGVLFNTYRHVTNFAIDPSNPDGAIVYVQPATNTDKMSSSFNTSITPVQKFSFDTNVAIGTDGYRYYTGLLTTVQKVVDGYDPDPTNYPGYRASGTQIEVVPPLRLYVTVNVVIATSNGISLSLINDSVKSAILNYIESLGVGQDVIVSEITAAVMGVEGVEAATLFIPSPTQERITVQDNQKAVITIDQITVSSG